MKWLVRNGIALLVITIAIGVYALAVFKPRWNENVVQARPEIVAAPGQAAQIDGTEWRLRTLAATPRPSSYDPPVPQNMRGVMYAIDRSQDGRPLSEDAVKKFVCDMSTDVIIVDDEQRRWTRQTHRALATVSSGLDGKYTDFCFTPGPLLVVALVPTDAKHLSVELVIRVKHGEQEKDVVSHRVLFQTVPD